VHGVGVSEWCAKDNCVLLGLREVRKDCLLCVQKGHCDDKIWIGGGSGAVCVFW